MRIHTYLSENRAVVQDERGEPAGILETTEPLLTHPGGESIDLDLTDKPDGFAPARPRVPVTLPAAATGSAALTGPGIAVGLPGARTVNAVKVEGRLYYADVYGEEADTDYVLEPTTFGFKSFWQLRSPSAPESVQQRLELPAGAAVAIRGVAPAQSAVVTLGDRTVATVSPAWAVDAEGEVVPVQMSVDGNDLTLTVEHRAADVTYPILLDPQVNQMWSGWEWASGNNDDQGDYANCTHIGSAHRRWYYSQWATYWAYFAHDCLIDQPSWGWGLWTSLYGGNRYGYGDGSEWRWKLPADTYATALAISGVTHGGWTPSGQSQTVTNVYGGLWAPGGWVRQAGSRYNILDTYWEWSPARGNPPAKRLLGEIGVGMNVYADSYPPYGSSGVKGVSVVMRDDEPPTIGLAAHSPATLAPNYDSTPWTNQAPSMKFTYADKGLGVSEYWVTTASGVRVHSPPSVCTEQAVDPCPTTAKTTGWTGLTGYGQLGDGITSMRAEVKDISGNSGTSPYWYLKLDRGAPKITFSGELVNERAQGLSGPSYDVRIHAADGDQSSNAARRAGVERVDVYVDDEWKAASETSSCTLSDSCGAAVDLKITDTMVADPLHGGHTITAIARDRVGNVSSQEFSFYLERPDEMQQAYLDAPPMSLTEVSTPPATEACTADPERYCGGADAPTVDEPPLIGDSFDASDEPIARAAKVQPDGWGLSDEHGEIFDIENQQDLMLRRYRKIIDWDVATTFRKEALAKAGRTDWQLARMDKWVERAAANGVPAGDMLISLSKSDSGRNRGLPRTKDEYIAAVNAIRLKWRHIATAHFAPWNEPNLGGKFSYAPYPRKAGNRFNDLRKACSQQPEGVGKCQPVAGDFADKRLTTDYVKDYTEAAGLTGETKYPWAIHLHDTGYTHDKAKWRAFRTNVKGPIWITESGAFRFQYKFNDKTKDGTDYVVGPDGVTPKNYRPRPSPGLPDDNDPEIAQMKDLKWLLDNPAAHERVERYYYYQWADHPNGEYANQDPRLKYDSYGTGLVAQPNAATPRKIYCVYANRENRTLRNNCS